MNPAKAVLGLEQTTMRQAQFLITAPCGYGAMPDLGLYTVPDGPIANWSQLLPVGKIDEARAAQEEGVELAADFLAALRAIERIRARVPRPRHPDRHGQ